MPNASDASGLSGYIFPDLNNIYITCEEGRVWTGVLSPSDVAEIESIGLQVEEFKGEQGKPYRRCKVFKPQQ